MPRLLPFRRLARDRPPGSGLGPALAAALLLAAAPLAGEPCPDLGTAPAFAAADLDAAVLLLGDGGQPGRQSAAVLAALSRELRGLAAALGDRLYVLFLGDNLYPVGLPPPTDPSHERRRLQLDRQLAVLGAGPPGPRAFFVPGNHDWDRGGANGLSHVRALGDYVAAQGAGRARVLPADGCPGPSVVDVGGRLRLVLLDSQWWLHRWHKPRDPRSPCAADSEAEVLAELARALGEAGDRRVLVAAHHPLASGGPHGLSRGGRRWTDGGQDLVAGDYLRLREGLTEVFRRRPPALFAAGHDHTLQLIRRPGGILQAVSGAASRLDPVVPVEGTLFCRSAPGYLRLDVGRDGRLRLSAVVVAVESGDAREAGALLLPP